MIVAASVFAGACAAVVPLLWPGLGALATAFLTAALGVCLLPVVSIFRAQQAPMASFARGSYLGLVAQVNQMERFLAGTSREVGRLRLSPSEVLQVREAYASCQRIQYWLERFLEQDLLWKEALMKEHTSSGGMGAGKEEPVIDQGRLEEVLGEDPELLKELVAVFLADAPNMLSSVQAAVEAADARGLEYAAHRLKGAVANFAAKPVVEAANTLEQIGRSGSLQGAIRACAVLQHEMTRLEPELRAISTRYSP